MTTAIARHEHTVAELAIWSADANHQRRVSLPALPFAWNRDDRAATAPRVGSIRYTGPLDPMRYDPILRSADARKDRG